MRTLFKNSKSLVLAAIIAAGMACPVQSDAAVKNVMCVKTNTGHYFPVVRVSMMVVPDGASTFEILLKDGEGEAGVKSISFEKHQEDIDFNKYKGDGSEQNIDLTKKVYLLTSTGKYYTVASMPTMTAKEGTELFDVTVNGTVESNVSAVYFYRGDDPEGAAGLDEVEAEEQLQLKTAISSQLLISGCGDCPKAVVYASNGNIVAEAPVVDGVADVQVGHLSTGAYIIKVGKKALKFMKK